MKIVVINGSPKGKAGNTNRMAEAFLKGAEAAGAETVNILLAEKDIKHCDGCHTCWLRGPGQCVIQDDMLEVLSVLGSSNIIVFASPVYFSNISGRLKVFMDRMTMIGSPHSQSSADNGKRHMEAANITGPRLMMLSSCGNPDRCEFDVTSLWINKVSEKMKMELAGEIYAIRGKYLIDTPQELQGVVDNYIQMLEKAGGAVASDMKLSKEARSKLEQVNDRFDTIV